MHNFSLPDHSKKGGATPTIDFSIKVLNYYTVHSPLLYIILGFCLAWEVLYSTVDIAKYLCFEDVPHLESGVVIIIQT